MSIRLTNAEKKIARALAEIKKKSGSHSPSPAMLAEVPGVTLTHDLCFLSNPYATDLFLKYWKKDFGKDGEKLRKLVELYPSQNPALAEKVGKMLDVPAKSIFVGNGATEVIQAVLHNFAKKKILVSVPTFSPYLEFVPKRVRVQQHKLRKENQFRVNLNAFISDVRKEKPDTVVIINPNNPDGGYVSASDLRLLLEHLRHVETVIVDESFVHFADENIEVLRGAAGLVKTFPNLVVIKSLSKDFGIAGLRVGYGVLSEERVSALLARGYLWNVSGFGEYFLNLLCTKTFLQEYDQARLRVIRERNDFLTELSKIKSISVYPSKANFFLVELLDGSKSEDLMVALLVRCGIYLRPCGDKVGLKGEFVRVASRRQRENKKLIAALSELLS